MGRRPTPTAIKKLQGNAGKRVLEEDEVRPVSGVPEMPRGLRKAARREWVRIVRELTTLGVLTVVDGKALMAYCDAYADWEEAQKDLLKNTAVLKEPIINKVGDVVGYKTKTNPAFTNKYTALKSMKSFLVEFGMTPASRVHLKANEAPKEPEDLPTREQMAKSIADDPDLKAIDTDKLVM